MKASACTPYSQKVIGIMKNASLNIDAKLVKSYLINVNTLIELTAAEYIHTMINNSR